ncbi:TonB-dependent receptor [Alteromonas pelagimontana]|uniref:TonB-dependent receptor n=1 Tax=Alteromonas pelagimontana TaxID=1858656 RepID=A0A6M4MEX2_9ALTE|nr:TonB-dependent receptor [Alteromonas pelagimontana]QJR81652.1 TonB-dependent receptor [Alteromonas pelagimontana]
MSKKGTTPRFFCTSKRIPFKLSAIALATFSFVHAAYGQEKEASAETDDVEVIQVSGIRGSLQRSIALKRDAKHIVDSISAEDIGQFPDTNLAESLQRISGVAIDRSGGEGRSVTVRGFGPEFNTVLLNGRRLASDTGARSFSFDVLPAELVSGVDVYKTQAAHLDEGGIGSTIVMHTPRPLAFDGFKAVASVKGLYEELSGKTSPQLFGMVSNTFADDKLGVLVSLSHQQRKNEINRFLTDGYIVLNRDEMPNIADQLAAEGYSADDQFFLPQNLNISPVSEDRERTTFSSTVQYRPTDALELTLDGLYSEFEVMSETTNVGVFFTPSLISDAEFDENGVGTSVTENRNADATRAVLNRPTKMYALGFNADWFASDTLNISFDTSWSRAESGGAENTDVVVMGLGVRDVTPSTVSYDENGFPTVSGVNEADLVDPSLAKAHFTLRGTGGGPFGGGQDFEDELFQQRVDGTWSVYWKNLTDISFGVQYSKQKQSTTIRLSQPEVLCAYCGFQVDVPNDLFSVTSIDADYLGGAGNLPHSWLSFDVDEAISYLESDEAMAANDAANGLPAGTTAALFAETNGFALATRPDSSEIEEEAISAYVNFALEGDLGDKPWNWNIGGRYVHTETTAIGISQILQDLVLSAADLYTPVLTGEQMVQQTNEYNYFLPTMDFRLNLTDDIIARVAASKTLTRPPLGALSPRTSIGTTRPGNLQASSGNPDLKPFISKNFDASLEWYYQEGGYITVGYFRKDVQNFLVSTVEDRAFPITDSEDLFAGDPIFEVSLVDNVEEATVDGVEIGAQYTFSELPGFWSGFGITGNATIVDSNAELDVDNTSQTFALVGLGNTYNIIGFYDYGPVEARVAWNQRDRFLQTARGFGGEPTYVEEYSQVDVRVSYDVTETVQVFVEGINVTDEKTKKVGRYDNQIMLYEETGPRYTVGVSATF